MLQEIGNRVGRFPPQVFGVIAGCCDALRFMAPRDNSRFKFFFSSLRLLDITYFYPFPLLLDWSDERQHTISYSSSQVKSVWRREGCEIQVKWEQPAGNLWLSKFVTCHCNLQGLTQDLAGKKAMIQQAYNFCLLAIIGQVYWESSIDGDWSSIMLLVLGDLIFLFSHPPHPFILLYW